MRLKHPAYTDDAPQSGDTLVYDAATETWRSSALPRLKRYTVATLPALSTSDVGAVAYATNGRAAGQAAGVGTGVPVCWDGSAWKVFYTGQTVVA